MTILTLADYKIALRELTLFTKLAARAGVANQWFTLMDAAGNPTAATLAIGNTANGLVPTDATTGAPKINFGSGAGYLTWSEFAANQIARFVLYDRLFHVGAYSFNSSVSLTAQPSFASRVPSGTDFHGLQLWIECVTTFTGSLSLAITYTDQDGNAAATTGTIVVGALTIGQMFQMPLASGDNGLRKIESLVATVASVGTFNIVIARPLLSCRVDSAGLAVRRGMEEIGMSQVWGDSCLALMMQTDSATIPTVDVVAEIASA